MKDLGFKGKPVLVDFKVYQVHKARKGFAERRVPKAFVVRKVVRGRKEYREVLDQSGRREKLVRVGLSALPDLVDV